MTPARTQFFAGHGGFGCQLVSIGKAIAGLCPDCGVEDNPGHRLDNCPHFAIERAEAQQAGLDRSRHLALDLGTVPDAIWVRWSKDGTEEIKDMEARLVALETSSSSSEDSDPDAPDSPPMPANRPRRACANGTAYRDIDSSPLVVTTHEKYCTLSSARKREFSKKLMKMSDNFKPILTMAENEFFNSVEEEILITEVQRHSLLYDANHKNYKMNIRREAAWRLIAEKTSKPIVFIVVIDVFMFLFPSIFFLGYLAFGAVGAGRGVPYGRVEKTPETIEEASGLKRLFIIGSCVIGIQMEQSDLDFLPGGFGAYERGKRRLKHEPSNYGSNGDVAYVRNLRFDY
ncbi:unnamed protein product [Bemisia tabaci]|uniref:MADF domain-containing protein n=1 Tax=Bemisia tabaci TaxID=7038 RepID=A0A9P0AP57_BEMTA|nr:unnamed protein product [Bemisia tabaci]